MSHLKANSALLICDLDNTLYDWFGYFVPSIYALIDEARALLGCTQDELIDSLRHVHRSHHDSEHPFALLETSVVKTRLSNLSPAERLHKLDPAFYAFNKSRTLHLKLFEGVRETLEEIARQGIVVVAHTESTTFGAVDRIARLGLEGYFQRIYCRQEPPAEHPKGGREKWRSEFPWDKVTRLPVSDVKPNARIIRDICAVEGAAPADVIYVGDSLARDMLMAKQAGSFAVWAKYGSRPSPRVYERLVRISHWTADDVAKEKALQVEASTVTPDFVCQHSFREVLPAIECARKRGFWSASA